MGCLCSKCCGPSLAASLSRTHIAVSPDGQYDGPDIVSFTSGTSPVQSAVAAPPAAGIRPWIGEAAPRQASPLVPRARPLRSHPHKPVTPATPASSHPHKPVTPATPASSHPDKPVTPANPSISTPLNKIASVHLPSTTPVSSHPHKSVTSDFPYILTLPSTSASVHLPSTTPASSHPFKPVSPAAPSLSTPPSTSASVHLPSGVVIPVSSHPHKSVTSVTASLPAPTSKIAPVHLPSTTPASSHPHKSVIPATLASSHTHKYAPSATLVSSHPDKPVTPATLASSHPDKSVIPATLASSHPHKSVTPATLASSHPDKPVTPATPSISTPNTIASVHFPSITSTKLRRRKRAATRVLNSVDQVSGPPLAPAVNDFPEVRSWTSEPLPDGECYRLVQLSTDDRDYWKVRETFKETSKNKNLEVVTIERVENPFLLGRYLLKREEMRKRYGVVREMINFHGTSDSNVHSICENNFDWKLHGKTKGNLYGKGVSFSPISFYASNYSDKSSRVKLMFYVRVLVSHLTLGDRYMTLPPEMEEGKWYDTTAKEDTHVLVKFSDDEYYPEFIIYYTKPTDGSCAKPMEQNSSWTYNDSYAQ